MATPEELEKARQVIVRFRELLDIMHQSIEDAEAAYAELFASLPPEQLETIRERELQSMAAHDLVKDPSVLGKALLQLRLDAKDLSKAFEELYSAISPK